MNFEENTPSVSVIIPNYNHACFLTRRITSVLNQTYQNFEVIYLDDASTDQSNAVFAQFEGDPRIKSILNQTNTGSPFKQWNKGIQQAQGKYIWIAESDDFADETFLEKLVPVLDANPNVGVAYSQSWEVDETDQILSNYQWFTDPLDPERWRHDFINQGIDECQRYLLFQNTIPNASAVLFRKSIYEQVGGASEDMRLCGDWLFWIKILMHSDIAFIAEPLNHFRKINPKGARGSAAKEGLFLEEKFRVLRYVCNVLNVSQEDFLKSLYPLVYYWVYFSLANPVPINRQLVIYRIIREFDPNINPTLIKMSAAILLKRLMQQMGITSVLKDWLKTSSAINSIP